MMPDETSVFTYQQDQTLNLVRATTKRCDVIIKLLL